MKCGRLDKEKFVTRQDALRKARPGQRTFRCDCGYWHIAVGSATNSAISERS